MSRQTVNINRAIVDPFYRYKMEKIESKIEGKGNGIKTVIANLSSVAHSLAREPGHVIKYFGFELGAQTNTNPADDRWIINGAHEASKLQDYLDGFIKKFVLCKKCNNPETDMTFPEGKIVLACKACGERSEADQRHKLSAFILKTIPKKGKKDKSTKKAERKARKEREQNQDEDGSNGSQNDSNEDLENEDDEAKDVDSDKDEITRQAENIKIADDKEAKPWVPVVDTSAAAVAARAQAQPDDLKSKLLVNGASSKSVDTTYIEFGEWLENEAQTKGDINKLPAVDVYLKAQELGIEKDAATLHVLAQALFTANVVGTVPPTKEDQLAADMHKDRLTEFESELRARVGMLKKMINKEDEHAEQFLGGIERLVGLAHPERLNNPRAVGRLLHILHEDEIVTEEQIRAFFPEQLFKGKVNKKGKTSKPKYTKNAEVTNTVRQNAWAFTKDPQAWEDGQAEEETESEEDDDESEEDSDDE